MATIQGNSANNNLNGTSDNDLIYGNGGNDTIYGHGGIDTLEGGDGNDILYGGDKSDWMYGGAGNDYYYIGFNGFVDNVIEYASQGNDTVNSIVSFILGANLENLELGGNSTIDGTGNSANNKLTGNNANNRLDGKEGIDTLIGGKGDDIYIVDSTTDTIIEYAGEGIDEVRSSVSYSLGAYLNKLTLTGAGAINGYGNSGDNILTGNNASNNLYGGELGSVAEGNDTIYGLGGDDELNGGEGNDYIDGGEGNDWLFALAGSDTLYGGSGNDYLLDNSSGYPNADDFFYGGSGNDYLDGGDGNNKLYGEAGNDTLGGGEENDTLHGGGGFDIVHYVNSYDVTVNLATGTTSDYDFFNNLFIDRLISIEGVIGSGGDDTLIGNSNDNFLYGDNPELILDWDAYGNDSLTGGGGNDSLYGSYGSDTLTGGSGADCFIFYDKSEGVDRITDFVVADDRIEVSASGFGGGLTPGATITSAQFHYGTAATDSSDRFIYNTLNGALFFDYDGLGGSGQVQIVTLVGAPVINENSIFVIA